MGARAQLVRHVAHLHRANAAAIFFAAKTLSTAKNAINTGTSRRYLPEHSNGPSGNGISQRLDRTRDRQRLLGRVIDLEHDVKHEHRAPSSKARRNYHPSHCHRDRRRATTHPSLQLRQLRGCHLVRIREVKPQALVIHGATSLGSGCTEHLETM